MHFQRLRLTDTIFLALNFIVTSNAELEAAVSSMNNGTDIDGDPVSDDYEILLWGFFGGTANDPLDLVISPVNDGFQKTIKNWGWLNVQSEFTGVYRIRVISGSDVTVSNLNFVLTNDNINFNNWAGWPGFPTTAS